MMGERETKLEWRFDDEKEWQTILAASPARPGEESEQQVQSLRGLATRRYKHERWVYPLVILLAALITLYVYNGEQGQHRRLRATLQAALEKEVVAWQTQNLTEMARLVDPQADPDWQADLLHNEGSMHPQPAFTIQAVERHDELVLVEVVATAAAPAWLSAPYRETRFYRQVVGRWLRTAPDPIFWGAPRTIDTAYFHFDFHQRDAATVAVVTTEIDAIYRRLRRAMGLSAPAAEQQWWIDIMVTDASHQRSTTIRPVEKRLFVPTPALWSAPVERSDAAILQALVIDALSDQLIQEARQQIKPKRQWLPMTAGVARWLSHQWGGGSVPSQQRYEEEHNLRRWLEDVRPLRLSDLTALPTQPPLPGDDAFILLGFTSQEEYEAVLRIRVSAAQRLIAYAVTTYGQERLPALLKALSAHATWETLIPAVFGVPSAQFEAGWQRYLHGTIQ